MWSCRPAHSAQAGKPLTPASRLRLSSSAADKEAVAWCYCDRRQTMSCMQRRLYGSCRMAVRTTLMPLLPRNFFMLFQEVSAWPISLSTPSSTSRMASGGAFRERISFRWSDLIWPTASRAASMIGATTASSDSTSPFLPLIDTCQETNQWKVANKQFVRKMHQHDTGLQYMYGDCMHM